MKAGALISIRTILSPLSGIELLLICFFWLHPTGLPRVTGRDLPSEDVLEVDSAETPTTSLRPNPQKPLPPVTTKPSEPASDFVFRVSHNRTDCIRAMFKVNLTVEYACTKPKHGGSKRASTSFCSVDIALPDPSQVSVGGRCGPEPILILRWSDQRLSLTFKFSQKAGEWFADHLDFAFDPKDKHFPNASEKKRKVFTAEKNLRLFKAPLNRSYTCNTTDIIDLGLGVSRHAGVAITESQVQVYHLPSTNKHSLFSEGYECPADERPRSPITAFVIASCLALLVILIIAGYYFSRRSNPSPYATVD